MCAFFNAPELPLGQEPAAGAQPNHWEDIMTAPRLVMVSTTVCFDAADGKGLYLSFTLPSRYLAGTRYTPRQNKWVELSVPPIDRSGVRARSVDVACACACGTHRGGTMLGVVSIH